tara:strand:- start:957 stop:2969 length:2013 start_codon:yes stop_codon:yes gene_type:complete
MKLLIKFSRILFLFCVATFGVKALKEPDVWWMLRTGEWIVQNGQVITSDYFSFTFFGTEWINVKWLFEIILYGFEQVGGPEFTPILQSIIYVVLFLFLEKRYRNTFNDDNNYLLKSSSFLLVAIVALLSIEFRIIGRPEMMSHLLAVLYLFIYEKYRKQPSATIWWLIPLQILWVNLHEAFGIGLVILVTMIVGSILDFYLTKKPIDRKFLLVSFLAVFAISINPRGIQMIQHPFEIFGQVGLNKYTIELVGFTDPLFWRKEGFLLIVFFAVSAVSLNRKNIKKILNTYGTGWITLYVLFFYLGFTAYRNIPFFILLSMPLAANYCYHLIKHVSSKLTISISVFTLILLVVLYGGIVSNSYYELTERRESFGLKVDPNKNPKGVTDFISKLNLKGNGFSDYLTSSYLMWNLRPNFKTYIDLRDLDVFSKPFFDNYLKLSADGKLFDKEDDQYDFNYAVVYAPQFDGLHFHLDRSKEWEMVYADNVAVLYLKRNQHNMPVIDSLFSVQVGTVFKRVKADKPSNLSVGVSRLFNPLFDPMKVDFTQDYDLIGATFFNRIRDYNAALYQCKLSIKKRGEQLLNLTLLGNIYLSLSQVVEEDSKGRLLNEARATFTKLIERFPNEPSGFKGLGIYYANIGDANSAINYFNRSNSIQYDAEVEQWIQRINLGIRQ